MSRVTGHGSGVNPKKFQHAIPCIYPFSLVRYCLEGVWRVSECCLEGFRRVSGRCLEGVWKVSGSCLEGTLKVLGGYQDGN